MATGTTTGRGAHESGQGAGTHDKSKDNTGGSVLEKAKDVAGAAAEKARDAAGQVVEKAKGAAKTVGKMADDAAGRVGEGMESLADTTREYGPQEGMLGTVTSKVAEGLDNAGQYLQEQGLSGMAKDVTDLIKRNPIPALLIGVAIGFLVARSMRSS
jgi:ElaB/YqjD/DUF883 family membrane-anchored ribosome-binding protein